MEDIQVKSINETLNGKTEVQNLMNLLDKKYSTQTYF